MDPLQISTFVTGVIVILSYILTTTLSSTFEFLPRAARYSGVLAYFLFFAASIWFPTWGAISYNAVSFVYLGVLLIGAFGWPAYAILCAAGMAGLESIFESADHPAMWLYLLPAVYFAAVDPVWSGHHHLSSSITEINDEPMYVPIAVAYTLYFSVIAVAAMIQAWGYGYVPALSLLILVLVSHFTFGAVTSIRKGFCLSFSERYSQWTNIVADVILVGALATTLTAFFYTLAFWFSVSASTVGNIFCVYGRLAPGAREWVAVKT